MQMKRSVHFFGLPRIQSMTTFHQKRSTWRARFDCVLRETYFINLLQEEARAALLLTKHFIKSNNAITKMCAHESVKV